MDVNGTKYHLLYGRDDWGRCIDSEVKEALSDLPDSDAEAQAALHHLWSQGKAASLEWLQDTGTLRLTRQALFFRRSSRSPRLEDHQRRGSGCDRYGNWYWIDSEEIGIRMLPIGAHSSIPYWSPPSQPDRCSPEPGAEFTPREPARPSSARLRGLAVTTHHYLVVGSIDQHGILVFDLHRRERPVLLLWPDDVAFSPWDMAPTPDGGLLILDRDNLCYWVLDRHFRLPAEIVEETGVFQPGGAVRQIISPHGCSLIASSPPEMTSPLSIEAGPDGHVLILDAPERGSSVVYEFEGERIRHWYSLKEALPVVTEDDSTPISFSIQAHDIAYVECCVGGDAKERAECECLPLDISDSEDLRVLRLLYVAERDGNQVIAFELNREAGTIQAFKDFLPLRRWEGKGLVSAGGRIYYDFADQWVPLQVLAQCFFATRAVLTTPIDFQWGLPEESFDSGEPGCVWHRLFLDAKIPVGTAVSVQARAADLPELLPKTPWTPQPDLHLRSNGSELPYYDRWSKAQAGAERTGTWEVLFQHIQGRYLQLELTILGSGRTTPTLSALRVWYPRFSYLGHYLPAIYREDPGPASFLERWLANFEGFFTNLEDRIEHVHALFDPRTAPAEALDWLGCWMGVVLDPVWAPDRRRFFIRHAHELYRWRGTVRGLEMALRIYLAETLDEQVLDPLCWGRSRLRIVEQFVTRQENVSSPVNAAHRFKVLIPHDLPEDRAQMVERIVNLERPAHASYEVKRYWDMFRVGEARVGLDTQVGHGSRLTPLVIGEKLVPGSYLEASYPFDVDDRIVLDRDRLDDFPPL